MSRHTSYRGATNDMESLHRENEKVTAIGNMPVNARGDVISRGTIIKTINQVANEGHETKSVVVSTGLKGKMPASPEVVVEPAKPVKTTKSAPKEKELPSGDIVIDGDTNAS